MAFLRFVLHDSLSAPGPRHRNGIWSCRTSSCLFLPKKKKKTMKEPWGADPCLKLLKRPRLSLWTVSDRTGVGSLTARTARFRVTTWTNSCRSRRSAVTAGLHLEPIASSFMRAPTATLYLHHSQRNHSCFRIGSTCCHCCQPGSVAER